MKQMKVEMLNEYHEFQSAEEAELWGKKHYFDLCGERRSNNPDYNQLFLYAGSGYLVYNRMLRNRWEDSEEEMCEIEQVTKILSKHKLPEPVIAYRYTQKRDIKSLCRGERLRTGLRFSDKAFFSTSLVKTSLEKFKQEYRCNCLLKLYLPRGIQSAYISLKDTDSRLNEQELLLQRDTEFEIVRSHWFSWPIVIECKAIVNTIPKE